VLDANLLTLDPLKIAAVKVLHTFVGGRARFGEVAEG
jgi:predicted amidohydrolase YtcJ